MFIHPMWDHESQRIGKQKCTPVGYAIHVVADLLGFFGLLSVFGVPLVLAGTVVVGAFRPSLLWLVVVPIALGLLGRTLYRFSWNLASRKGFRYDHDQCEASWLEAGQRRTYKWPP
jgi:hypothetical protein